MLVPRLAPLKRTFRRLLIFVNNWQFHVDYEVYNMGLLCFSYFQGHANWTTTLPYHLISLIFLFLTILRVFLDHLPPLTSYQFLALISFLVLALSLQLPQLFGTPFLTPSSNTIHLTLFSGILKHILSKQLSIPPSGKPRHLRFIYVTNGAYKCFTYLLTYLHPVNCIPKFANRFASFNFITICCELQSKHHRLNICVFVKHFPVVVVKLPCWPNNIHASINISYMTNWSNNKYSTGHFICCSVSDIYY